MEQGYLLSKLVIEGARGIDLDGDVLRSCDYVPSTFCIPSGIVELAPYCLSGQNDLKYITITSTVKNISKGVFANCNNLLRITAPEHLREFNDVLTMNNRAEVIYVSSNKYGK